jgi:hypothetical protein
MTQLARLYLNLSRSSIVAISSLGFVAIVVFCLAGQGSNEWH